MPEPYPFRDPLDYLGYDGGAGVGSGPGNAIGAALALLGGERLTVAVVGDGDFLQGATALWTAVHYRTPALIVVANNRSHLNDELIQERIDEPAIDIAALARGQGVAAEGPITRPAISRRRARARAPRGRGRPAVGR